MYLNIFLIFSFSKKNVGVRDKAAQYIRIPKLLGRYLFNYIWWVHYHVLYLNIKLQVSSSSSFQSVMNFPFFKED